MTDESLTTLLSALGIAAFERRADGAFAAVGPLPGWLRHLSKDMTFPFLGAFLDEAREFWDRAQTGQLKSGLCAEVDESGREFHFEVSAVAVPGRSFLLFELAPDSEQVRAVLQRARELTLDREQLVRSQRELRAAVTLLGTIGPEVRSAVRTILDSAQELHETPPGPQQQQLLQDICGVSERLLSSVEGMVEASRVFTRKPDPG